MLKFSGSPVGGLHPSAYRAGGDELLGVTGHRRPPEPLLEKVMGAGYSGVARQLRRVSPLQDLGTAASGTNKVFAGTPPGSVDARRASHTRSFTCQASTPTTQASGRIGSGSCLTGSAENWRDDASGLVFLDPGQ